MADGEVPKPQDPAAGYASPAEATAAIHALTKAEYAKLERLAMYLCRSRLQGTSKSWEDLLHDAIVKTFEGDRRWRSSEVTILKHLDRTMESLSSHIAESQSTQPADEDCESRVEDPTSHPAGPFVSSVEARASAREEVQGVYSLFADDPEALRVLDCRGRDMKGSEILADLGMSKAQYDTISKRIRRTIMKYASG
jgi:hypothetical protein